MKIVFIFILLIISTGASGQALIDDDCSFLRDHSVKIQIQEFLDKEAKTAPIINGYHLSAFPIALIDPIVNPQCILMLKSGRSYGPSYLKSVLPPENGLYDFMSVARGNIETFSNFLSQNLTKEVGQNEPQIMLFNIQPEFFKGLAEKTKDSFFKQFIKSNMLLIFMLIHEGFHQFGQSGPDLGERKIWPLWAYGHKPMKINKCYSVTKEVSNLFDEESLILLKIFKNLSNPFTANNNTQLIKDYFKTRNKRYQMVNAYNGTPESKECVKEEAIGEMVEGFAEYMALSTLNLLGVMSSSDILKYCAVGLGPNNYDDAYYKTGALKLLITQISLGSSFQQALEKLFQSEDWQYNIDSLIQTIPEGI